MLVKAITTALSVVNVSAGFGLVVLHVATSDSPPTVLALGLALLIQGGFTLASMLNVFGFRHNAARKVQLVGSTFAVIVGVAGFTAGFLANFEAAGIDPEYGPMTMALLVAVHGLVSLLAFSPRRPARTPAATS